MSLRHRGFASHAGKVSFLSFPFFLVLRIVAGELGALVSRRGTLSNYSCWSHSPLGQDLGILDAGTGFT